MTYAQAIALLQAGLAHNDLVAAIEAEHDRLTGILARCSELHNRSNCAASYCQLCHELEPHGQVERSMPS
jgi:hypothetical protein